MTVCIDRRPATAMDSVHATRSFDVGHVKALPSNALSAYVEHYWITRWDRREAGSHTARALLEPCVHLHLRDGHAEVMGVVRDTYCVRLDGKGFVIGVRFRPGGFFTFTGRPVAEWTDRTVPLGIAVGHSDADVDRRARMAWDAIASSAEDSATQALIAARHLDALLEPLLSDHDPLAQEITALVETIAAQPEVRRVDDLVVLSGRSERTLHRLFLRYVGVSPAWVIRRYRLHAAAEQLARTSRQGDHGLAYAYGYADQAHFIRDFRATLGITPGEFVRRRR